MPLVEYLRKKTNLNITLIYEEDNSKLLEKFKAGKVHMFTAGPLLYYVLKKEFPHAEALVHINEDLKVIQKL
ncbi:MAG: hypothetical protein D6674_00530 [Acidobacteria bacterium]|jgi:ABC-type phosphate/phosphonate transport system substrate-binding protein|nr:MAG: hypothetical protein D6674_00530 [Acidobacteriota bacterium]